MSKYTYELKIQKFGSPNFPNSPILKDIQDFTFKFGGQ